jgi:hypothetical protein
MRRSTLLAEFAQAVSRAISSAERSSGFSLTSLGKMALPLERKMPDSARLVNVERKISNC